MPFLASAIRACGWKYPVHLHCVLEKEVNKIGQPCPYPQNKFRCVLKFGKHQKDNF